MKSDIQKIAMVTGAGTGIGRAVASRSGRRVTPSCSPAGAGAAGRPLAAESPAGGAALVVPTDVTRRISVARSSPRPGARFGRLDLLFNNAGARRARVPLEELSLEEWRRWWTST